MSESVESFSELFDQSIAEVDMRPGSIVKATIVDKRANFIIVNAQLKSEALIPLNEFHDEVVQLGDEIDVVIKTIENGFGETCLSYEEAKRVKSWKALEASYEKGEPVIGQITERVKGGFTVSIEEILAFLPGSLVDIKPVRDMTYLEGKDLEFKIIKMDQKRNNVVVSRRAVIREESGAERIARLEELQEGQEILGIVKNITDYGAFVDLGGVDGLLHVTDISWKRVKHPSELLTVGDKLRVKIMKLDRSKNRVSLGVKQLAEDPWRGIAKRYEVGSRYRGVVTNVADYGCFVELEPGVEGLVHMSEMDWTNRNVHPSKVVSSGEEIEVVVLDVDEGRRRISLGIKQCRGNPWEKFASEHKKEEVISGQVRSITDFGVFLGLEGGIDGLIHYSDISWEDPTEAAVQRFKKGDTVDVVILAIDTERERISLGVKQLQADPVAEFMDTVDPDKVFQAKLEEVDQKYAILQITDSIAGTLKISDYRYEHVNDLRTELKKGDVLDVKVIGLDRKAHRLLVSHKILQEDPRVAGEAVKKKKTPPPAAPASAVPSKTTLGDLLKEQMQGSVQAKEEAKEETKEHIDTKTDEETEQRE